MWQFLTKLIDRDLTVLAMILAILFIVAVIVALCFGYKILKMLIQKKTKLKYKDAEINLSDEDEKGLSTDASNISFLKTNYILSTIVTDSIRTGYQNCKKREELLDNQIHNMRDQLNLLHVSILKDYDEKQPGTTHDLASIALKASFEKIITVPLKDTFVADRLAELDQDSLIEKHRPLIDCAFAEVKQDIVKSLQHEALKDIKVDLVQALHNYEMDFKKIIVEILTFAWKEAKKFLKEVSLQNDMLNEKINSLLTNYAEVAQDLPESWISSESATPPVDLVGGR